jgi:hypothetical protein
MKLEEAAHGVAPVSPLARGAAMPAAW